MQQVFILQMDPLCAGEELAFAKGCPSVEYGKFQSYSASGKFAVSLALLEDRISYTDGLLDIVFQCMLEATAMVPDVQLADATQAPVLAGEGTIAQVGEAIPVETVDPVSSALDNTTQDLAPTQSEITQSTSGSGGTGGTNTNTATGTTSAQPPPPSVVPPATVIGTIRIIFRLP